MLANFGDNGAFYKVQGDKVQGVASIREISKISTLPSLQRSTTRSCTTRVVSTPSPGGICHRKYLSAHFSLSVSRAASATARAHCCSSCCSSCSFCSRFCSSSCSSSCSSCSCSSCHRCHCSSCSCDRSSCHRSHRRCCHCSISLQVKAL